MQGWIGRYLRLAAKSEFDQPNIYFPHIPRAGILMNHLVLVSVSVSRRPDSRSSAKANITNLNNSQLVLTMHLQVRYIQRYTALTPRTRVGSVVLSGMCRPDKYRVSADPDVFYLHRLSVRKILYTMLGLCVYLL